jgi:hypothetical protein
VLARVGELLRRRAPSSGIGIVRAAATGAGSEVVRPAWVAC